MNIGTQLAGKVQGLADKTQAAVGPAVFKKVAQFQVEVHQLGVGLGRRNKGIDRICFMLILGRAVQAKAMQEQDEQKPFECYGGKLFHKGYILVVWSKLRKYGDRSKETVSGEI